MKIRILNIIPWVLRDSIFTEGMFRANHTAASSMKSLAPWNPVSTR